MTLRHVVCSVVFMLEDALASLRKPGAAVQSLRNSLVIVVLAGFMAIALPQDFAGPLGMETAEAQSGEQQQRRRVDQGFNPFRALRNLFSGDGQRNVREPRVRQPRGDRRVRVAPARPAPVVPPVPAKAPDAKIAMVFGDGMATELAEGLVEAFERSADIRIVDRSRPDIGLINDAIPRMRSVVETALENEKFDVAVVLVGSNDRVSATDTEGRSYGFRDENWSGLYGAFVEQTALKLITAGKPVIWVGLPPLQDTLVSRDHAYMNDVFDRSLVRVGGRYVDVWNGFVDGEGHYISEGPDHTGQIATLRAEDGKGFTDAGRRKLAFFVESRLERVLRQLAPAIAGLDGANNPFLITVPFSGGQRPEIWEIAVTGPASLGRVGPLAGADLSRNDSNNGNNDDDDGNGVLNGTAPTGRVDNFSRVAAE